MMIESTVQMATAPSGTVELRRHWQPASEPWATLLMVHGVLEHSGRWERAGSQFAEAGLDVWAFDLAGHGGSGGKRGHIDHWDEYIQATHSQVVELRRRSRPVILLGASNGAHIALSGALSDHPDADALVLVAPPATCHGLAKWQEFVSMVLAPILPKLLIPANFKGEQFSRDPSVGEAYFADPLVSTKATVRLGREGFAAIRANAKRLRKLQTPTLVLHGGADTIVPPQCSAALAELPTVERKLYPTLRHELFNEPEGPEVIADVIEWLRKRVLV
jgi:alpha-beta hydrolase superfamily lysophospholipase